MHNLVTEDSLVTRSSEFETLIQNGERSSLRALCEKKSQESEYVTDLKVMRYLCYVVFESCQ